MKRNRRNLSAHFKAKEPLNAVRLEQLLTEFTEKYGVYAPLIIQWKADLFK